MTHTSTDSLYVNGCSFAYGIGTDAERHMIPSHRFSRFISEEFELVDDNRSKPGSCNSRIARDTILDFQSGVTPKLAIIIWSDPARTEYYDNSGRPDPEGSELTQVRPSMIDSIEDSGVRNTMNRYYDNVSCAELDVMHTLYHMCAVKNTADLFGIPCIQMHFRENFYLDLSKSLFRCYNKKVVESIARMTNHLSNDPNIFGMDSAFSFYSFVHSYKDLSQVKDQEGHPGRTSHIELSKWLIDIINENNII